MMPTLYTVSFQLLSSDGCPTQTTRVPFPWPADGRRCLNQLLPLQASGLAGIVLKYSVTSRPYYPAADKVVVPSQWFTHLPAGYLPGLAVQACSRHSSREYRCDPINHSIRNHVTVHDVRRQLLSQPPQR